MLAHQVNEYWGESLEDFVTAYTFARRAAKQLEASSNFARDFVDFKMQFFRNHQYGYVFSNRFGADFFSEVCRWISRGDFLEPDADGKLGEFDRNFNAWLKTARTEK